MFSRGRWVHSFHGSLIFASFHNSYSEFYIVSKCYYGVCCVFFRVSSVSLVICLSKSRFIYGWWQKMVTPDKNRYLHCKSDFHSGFTYSLNWSHLVLTAVWDLFWKYCFLMSWISRTEVCI
jgi:hypothetical protein